VTGKDSMSESSVMHKLQGLNQDLESMADLFTRVVKAARIRVEGDARTNSGATELADVLVESLVAKGSSALDKVGTLNRTLTLGNSDKHVYSKVKGTQQRLQKLINEHAPLVAIQNGSPALELQSLLARMEKHYYASLVPPEPQAPRAALDDEIAELCSQALHSVLRPRTAGQGASTV
jgi:uncharacterized Zn ribbon protein